jgi:hypothetical protein
MGMRGYVALAARWRHPGHLVREANERPRTYYLGRRLRRVHLTDWYLVDLLAYPWARYNRLWLTRRPVLPARCWTERDGTIAPDPEADRLTGRPLKGADAREWRHAIRRALCGVGWDEVAVAHHPVAVILVREVHYYAARSEDLPRPAAPGTGGDQ